MKKILIIIFCFMGMLFTSCELANEFKYHELFETTDAFVNSLYTTHKSYGLFNIEENVKYTSDREYKICPIGRLINVRIERYATDVEYETLVSDLKFHYRHNDKVNDVYRCKAGTIMIDCRNK